MTISIIKSSRNTQIFFQGFQGNTLLIQEKALKDILHHNVSIFIRTEGIW